MTQAANGHRGRLPFELLSPAAMPKYALPFCLLSAIIHRMLGSDKKHSRFELSTFSAITEDNFIKVAL